jgi:regulation of enolase protein 1 (concanavalin A-like superfamily)
VDDEPFGLVRLAPLDTRAPVHAGPFCCAPERTGLQVRFTGWSTGPADASLH